MCFSPLSQGFCKHEYRTGTLPDVFAIILLDVVLFAHRNRHKHFVQHIFDKNAIAGGRIVDKDMSNGARQFAVLNDGTAGQVCGQ